MGANDRPAVSLDTMLGGQNAGRSSELIQRYLAEAREQLQMEVAYVAEFRDGQRLYRYVEGDTLPESVRVGTGEAVQETYAQRVVDGRIESVVPDAQANEQVRDLRETRECGIGSFVGVPIRLANGNLYGVLAAFSGRPAPILDGKWGKFLEAFARLIADQLADLEEDWDDLRQQLDRVDRVITGGGLSMVYQPVFDIRTREVVGAEALARFSAEPKRTPDAWFDEAWTVGRGVDLELAALASALDGLRDLPEGTFLAVNISPQTVVSPRLRTELAGLPAERLVLEVPERAPVEDQYALGQSLEFLRALGVRLAADDAGAGFDSLSNILELKPDIIKFDVALTRDVDTDPLRQSLAASMVSFADQFGAMVIAEGIETEGELSTLRDIGFGHGQGYHLARPGPLPLAER